VNLHHTKSLALTDDLKKKISAKSLRKVVPVCKNCHLNRHGGSFRQPKKVVLLESRVMGNYLARFGGHWLLF